MPFTTGVASYLVIYSANTFRPRIGLLNAANQFIGQAVFFPNGAVLPADFQRANGQVDLHYHLDDFHNVLDIVRNEKPVFLNFNGSGPGFENNIRTGNEPTGEGE
jgi:hypothetical protein